VFVGTLIAGREVEIGFQRVSELGNFPGVDYVGPLPADVQQTTVFSTGMIVGAKEAETAKTLVNFLTTPEAGAAFKKRGMEPG
jgi:molybdate transport system substrate-binding protein